MAQLGRYEILEQRGTGSMGNVYRARDTALDREVAVKTIRTGVDVDPEVRQRFYREARACARLQHPNIITVFDLGEVDNTAYIAMELLEGADFRHIIEERRSMTVEAKIAAAAEVCDAVAHAHRHGVIHRDIKPSNLFMTSEGLTKVLDFGIARLPSSKLTVAGQVLGTPNYMAPEQILARPSDGRADLFSAAVVFFEFLTYAHPFQSSLIPRRIVQSEPDSLFDYDAALPVILERIMARGLAKDPDLRYQTGDEFAADLRTVLDALRGNSSPGFSGVQLPSQRILPIQPLPSIPSATVQVPEGQDPQEWRLSEALRLLPEFEAAVERRDLPIAQATVAELEIRLAGDIRFLDAIRLCRSRLVELMNGGTSSKRRALDQSTLSVTAAKAAADLLPTPPPLVKVAAAGTVDLDATLFGLPARTTGDPPSQPPPPLSQEPPEPGVSPLTQPLPVPTAPVLKPATVPRPNLQRRKSLIIAAGIVLCALLLTAAGVVVLRPVPVQPAVATAVVGSSSVNLFAAAGAASKRIASIAGGTQLNVLRLPTSRDQEWVNVQVVKPKASRAGYVRAAELRDWQGRTGASALSLVRSLGPGEAGTDEQINGQIEDLSRLASRFPGEPAAREARLDIVRLRLALAQRRQGTGRPLEDWQPEIKAAQQELEAAGGDQNLQERMLALSQQGGVSHAQNPPVQPDQPATKSPPSPQQPAVNVSELLAKARQLRDDGDNLGAEGVLESILRASPGNQVAKELLNKIKRARDAEQK